MHHLMDRHHILDLFEKLHATYDIKEGEYKEFVDALGAKKQPVDINDAKMVKVVYDLIMTDVEFSGEEVYPKIHCRAMCSHIWMVVDDVRSYHGSSCISHTYMYHHEMHASAVKRLAQDFQLGYYTPMTLDMDTNQKYCLRVISIEKIA